MEPTNDPTPSPYAAADAYQSDAMRTRSRTYRPDLLRHPELDGLLLDAAAQGRAARELKRACFGGVPMHWSPGRLAESRTGDLDAAPADLLHAVLGLVNEAGELAEHLHKVIFSGAPLDRVNVREELGDVGWFVALGARANGDPLSAVLAANIAKLRARFPGCFDAAQMDDANRDRAAERAALAGPPGAAPPRETFSPVVHGPAAAEDHQHRDTLGGHVLTAGDRVRVLWPDGSITGPHPVAVETKVLRGPAPDDDALTVHSFASVEIAHRGGVARVPLSGGSLFVSLVP